MNAPAKISIDDLPIPKDVVPGEGWGALMCEMADHIGAYETLLIVDRYGGQEFYVPLNPDNNKLTDLIGPEKAAIMSRVYGRERLDIPTARFALRRARGQPILAQARAGQLTVAEAARILKTTRSYASRLVNHSADAVLTGPRRRLLRKVDPRQIDMFEQQSG